METTQRSMQLTNVICSAQLGCDVHLRDLCNQLANVRYDPARFPGLMWKHRRIGGNCLVFSNGTIQCQGKAANLKEGIRRVRRYVRVLQKLGWPIMFNRVRILTVSGFHILSGPVDFNRLVKERRLIYEPELFPTANLTVDGITFSCFHNGKVVITGIKRTSDVNRVVHPTLVELELYTL